MNSAIPVEAQAFLTPLPSVGEFKRVDRQTVNAKIQDRPVFDSVQQGYKPSQLSEAPHTTAFKADVASKAAQELFTIGDVPNSSLYPYSTVGLLLITSGNSTTYSTGVLVGRNIMLTTGTNFPWGKPWNARFIPGYNKGSAPFGTADVTQIYGYDPPSNQVEYDYVVCHLATDIGDQAGYMGAAWFSNLNVISESLWTSVGYPAGTVQVFASNVPVQRTATDGTSEEFDTPTFASGGWVGGPLWNFGNLVSDQSNLGDGPYALAVWAGLTTVNNLFSSTTYDAQVGGEALFNLIIYAISNWTP